MFNPDSGQNIWVSNSGSNGSKEDGTYEAPYSTITEAINNAVAGSTVVIKEGTYDENVTIQELKGEETSPITIIADPQSEAVILKGEWYLYEVSDFIISGFTFLETANNAISIIGNSERNIIKDTIFIKCGEKSECTLFLGGSNGKNNVIENCQFSVESGNTITAIIVAQSEDSEDETSTISTNSIIRYCTFENYKTAIILGTGDDIETHGNHIVKENLFVDCNEGIRDKSVASEINENIFRGCNIGVNQIGGSEVEITDNRFEVCNNSIHIENNDISISHNCCIDSPIHVKLSAESMIPLIISNNSFIFTDKKSAITIHGRGNEFSIIVSDNLLYNGHIDENSAIRLHKNEFFPEGGIEFEDIAKGDFRCDSVSVGCKKGATFRTKIIPIPQVDLREHGFEDKEKLSKMDERDLYLKSLFVINEDDNDETFMDSYDDGENENPEDNEWYDFED